METMSVLAAFGHAYQRQWLLPDRLRAFQLRQLRRIVDHAWAASPFYRDLWGARPQLDTLDDLAALPVISKEDIHDHTAEIVAPGFSENNCVVDRTSGSSGLVLTVLTDRE